MEKTAEEIKEQARLFAESKMINNWDRKDHISIGVFYHYFVEYIINHASQFKQPTAWISVEDRLPDVNKEVLVYPKYNDIPIQAFLSKNNYWVGSFETRDWMIDGYVADAVLNKSCEITHWQPLPTPPSK